MDSNPSENTENKFTKLSKFLKFYVISLLVRQLEKKTTLQDEGGKTTL